MRTTEKTKPYAAKLRARLKYLIDKRAKDNAAYTVRFAKWKLELAKWIKENYQEKCEQIGKSEHTSGWGRDAEEFSHVRFFAGSPKKPKKPSSKQIAAIRKMLQHLAITGQPTISVDEDDIKELFEDGDDE